MGVFSSLPLYRCGPLHILAGAHAAQHAGKLRLCSVGKRRQRGRDHSYLCRNAGDGL